MAIFLALCFYAATSAFVVLLYWFIIIRFGDASDLDQESVLVRLFSRSRAQMARGVPTVTALPVDHATLRKELLESIYRASIAELSAAKKTVAMPDAKKTYRHAIGISEIYHRVARELDASKGLLDKPKAFFEQEQQKGTLAKPPEFRPPKWVN